MSTRAKMPLGRPGVDKTSVINSVENSALPAPMIVIFTMKDFFFLKRNDAGPSDGGLFDARLFDACQRDASHDPALSQGEEE